MRKSTLVLMAVIAVVVIFLLCVRKNDVIIVDIDDAAELTEELAIEISRKALQLRRLEDPLLQPRTYNDKNYFARNIYNPDSGYVLWKWKDGRRGGYTVRLEREGKTVNCHIGPNDK